MSGDAPKDTGSSGASASTSEQSPRQVGPGPVLAAAREDMGVSTREIADALNLPLRVVEGIEANDASVLPATAFARGYVRSYAKLFDLDADALVGAYEDMVGETHTAEVVVVPTPEPSGLASFVSGQPPLVWAIAAGVAVVLILLLVWLLGTDDSAAAGNSAADNSAAGNSAANSAAVDSSVARNLADADRDAADIDDRVVFEPNIPDEPLAQREVAVASNSTADVQAPVAQGPAGAESTPASSGDDAAAAPASRRRLTEAGDDTLSIRFAEDSWLVIRDGEGRKLYSNLGKRGAELSFVGQAPFRLVIGYAPGATLRFNGDSVALAPHTRNDVAKLFLGQ